MQAAHFSLHTTFCRTGMAAANALGNGLAALSGGRRFSAAALPLHFEQLKPT